jgi:catechol 2,3-dioxygenase-like lactoylglutathione lyase family enzyme
MTQVSVRYVVDDAAAATAFYRDLLGFEVERTPAPGFAMLARGGLRLLLSEPRGPGGAAQPAADGRRPEPGGWNRVQLEVDDLDAAVQALRRAGATLRSEPVQGRGGAQVLVEDPSGNPVELFQPAAS